MEGNAAAAEKAIRQSQSLCAGEQEYVHKRKQAVMKRLNSLGINCTENNVPHIALLGSGGGQRADVGFMGTLYQMEKEGLLDTLVYLGGISGSTWCMSSVYKDPEWSSNMDRAMSRLFSPDVEHEQVLDWLCEKDKDKDFSLSDVWGALTSAKFIKELDQRHLSDEARRKAFNPYPIYNAMNKDCFTDGPTEGKWFEFSPHEAGFTELGFFIETSLLGSKFKGGELLEKKPEMDMIKLEGILGSALASGEVIKDYISQHVTGILHLPSYNRVETRTKTVEAGFRDKVKLVGNIFPLIVNWEWGTTENFLYQQDPTVPTYLSSKERFHLMDAGLQMNVPYPPFLGDRRDIDLIIAPDYSAGDVFETLTLARDYAAEVKKPFPEIDDKILEERDWPKDCYVFEGKGKEPTIVYMPLFNRRNCKDAAEVKAKMDKFSTFQRPYSKKKIEFLLETVKANLKSNKETLLKEINKAARRREKK